jgi:hypothetical protein
VCCDTDSSKNLLRSVSAVPDVAMLNVQALVLESLNSLRQLCLPLDQL